MSLSEQIGAGRGDWLTEHSSVFIINRDPFRAIRRGRQLFQRKFTVAGGQGPAFGDGTGNIERDRIIGAGLADSCAACHGRPRGSAGFGGGVVTRPDSRDAPHLFGLGLKEMLPDEMTSELQFETLSRDSQREVIAFLNSLVLFPPDDTASNLDPGDPSESGFPQRGHGSIRLTGLFNNPSKIE